MKEELREVERHMYGYVPQQLLEKMERFHPLPALKSAMPARQIYMKVQADLDALNFHAAEEHANMWDSCCKAVSIAPPGSLDLGLSYAARSRVLQHFLMYTEARRDVNRAIALMRAAPEPYNPQDMIDVYARKIETSLRLQLSDVPAIFEELLGVLDAAEDGTESKVRMIAAVEQLDARLRRELQQSSDGLLQPGTVDGELDREPVGLSSAEELAEKLEVVGHPQLDRQVVAKRGIPCGEVICAERFYAAVPRTLVPPQLTSCDHCLGSSWTPVACVGCPSLYCGEPCREEAWRQYHEFECQVLGMEPSSIHDCREAMDEPMRMALRLFLRGYVEAGRQLPGLRALCAEVDAVGEPLQKGRRDGRYEVGSFRTCYALQRSPLYSSEDKYYVRSILAVMLLARRTDILGPEFQLRHPGQLARHPDARFVGALIFKLCAIACANMKKFVEPNTSTFRESNGLLHFTAQPRWDFRGRFLAAYPSFLNHSCFPNAQRVCTEDGKVLYYALLPIERGAAIYECYDLPFYSMLSRAERRSFLMEAYHFRCYCDACKLNYMSTTRSLNNATEHSTMSLEGFEAVPGVCEIVSRFEPLLAALASSDLQTRRSARRQVAADIALMFSEPREFPNRPAIALFYMLRIGFDRTAGPIQLIVPSLCGYPGAVRPQPQPPAGHNAQQL